MSVDITYYLGPFAEFRAPMGVYIQSPDNQALSDMYPMSSLIEPTGDGKDQVYVCRFVPNRIRPNRPDRQFSMNDSSSYENIIFATLDIDSEKAWFSQAYLPELLALQKQSGVSFRIRWGLLKGCS